MNIQRFNAPTAREALAKARLAFGDGTLILSNRPTADGIEVVATAENSLLTLDRAHATALSDRIDATKTPKPLGSVVELNSKIEDDMAQLSMSTLSFQDYVRERMLRRRHETMVEPLKAEDQSSPRSQPVSPNQTTRPDIALAPKAILTRKPEVIHASVSNEVMPKGLMDELSNMRELIEERFNALTWLGQARQHPITSNLMLKFLRAGYSPLLARAILEKMPQDSNAAESMQWVLETLERNLKTNSDSQPIYEEGGTYALVGSTGVGKTTTAAKLARLCAQTHGAASVGLVTLDTSRAGAHEQLRSYGQMLGVVAHQAHDRAALQDLLGLLGNKKMILIDTAGFAPHDVRLRDMMDILELPNVNRLLILNAGCQGDTLDDIVTSFKSSGLQQTILTKLDEAVKLGPVIDAAIRHQLRLRGVTNGQKVQEDWDSAIASRLIRTSMQTHGKSAFEPRTMDIGFFFTQSSSNTQQQDTPNA